MNCTSLQSRSYYSLIPSNLVWYSLGNRSKVALGEERSYFDYLPEIISSYSKAVAMNGSGSARYAQQALPRMLTLYCDYGTDALSRRSMGSKERAAATSVRRKHIWRG